VLRRLLPILGITFIDILGFSILIPLLPFYVEHFGASAIVVGFLFATFSFCQLVAGPVWGAASDRIGRKRVLIVSQIGATIGWTTLAFAPNLTVVFVARVIEGLSGGNLGVTQAYVADLVEPAQRPQAFAYVGAAFGAGLVFGPATGGLLAGQFGYAAPLLLAAGLQFVTLIVTIVALPESRSEGDEPEVPAGPAEIVRELRDPALLPVLARKLAYGLAIYGWFAVFALALQQRLGLGARSAGYVFAGFGVASVAFQLLVVGRLATRVGERRASDIGLVALAAAFALAVVMHAAPIVMLMVVVFAGALAIENATLASLVSGAAPESQRGAILGVAASLDGVAGIVMPPISTGLLGAYGVTPIAALCGALAIVALAAGTGIGRRRSVVESI